MSQYYTASRQSFIDARVPPKRNSGEKLVHRDCHYTCSQVNLVNEMTCYSPHGTVYLSVDNKNKVAVGNPTTSRRANIRKFYLVPNAPNYNDHDFPHRKAKPVPAGYQLLTTNPSRSRSVSPRRRRQYVRKQALSESSIQIKLPKDAVLAKDKLGRDKLRWQKSGPLTVQMYPSRAIESTNVMHVNFLVNYLHNMQKTK